MAWERIRAELAAHSGTGAGTVRICGFPTAVAGLIAPAGRRLRDEGYAVRIAEAEASDAFGLLLVEDADIAVVVPTGEGPTLDDPRFDQWPLLDEPQDLLVPADHPLASRPSARLTDAAHEPWIAPAPGTCDQHQLVTTACAAAGFVPDVTHHAVDWSATSALVDHDLGVALIPRLACVPAEHAVVRVPLTGPPVPSRRIVAAVRRGSESQPAIADALKALHERQAPLEP